MATPWAKLPMNVGVVGGDLTTRRFSLVVMLLLTVVSIPWLGFSHSDLKIAAFVGALSGTLFLMAGLVFLQTTHYAGVSLILSPLAMVALSAVGLRWLAVLLGAAVVGASVQNLLTRRCGVNKLMGVNSCPPTTEAAEPGGRSQG